MLGISRNLSINRRLSYNLTKFTHFRKYNFNIHFGFQKRKMCLIFPCTGLCRCIMYRTCILEVANKYHCIQAKMEFSGVDRLNYYLCAMAVIYACYKLWGYSIPVIIPPKYHVGLFENINVSNPKFLEPSKYCSAGDLVKPRHLRCQTLTKSHADTDIIVVNPIILLEQFEIYVLIWGVIIPPTPNE